ncbi:unnamed protein product [Vitrella brassicaformis CCMP3155]|uniref:Uncharacterized protein n=2 Tax=Vitrella brassicaformis TaxID=1169539 RepID=A0A0G4EES7_VITBC|nr:unnamed protein product [Vitrella brassicaformis CCMP3155]|eukprot:CEL93902.1 unnamed protein product [Vitrella brassicaformis CCMP3155]
MTQHTRVHPPVPLHRLKYPPLPLHLPAEYRRQQEAATYQEDLAALGEEAARESVEILRASGVIDRDWKGMRVQRDIQGLMLVRPICCMVICCV